mmetsp:Transcript_93087/g.249208  ORF Transcript_93087/g.249208 Transcript_93087/m.249208 type:complete len:335 (-) Transcript_93087:199-1203(-)
MDRAEVILGCVALAVSAAAIVQSLDNRRRRHDQLLVQLLQDRGSAARRVGGQDQDGSPRSGSGPASGSPSGLRRVSSSSGFRRVSSCETIAEGFPEGFTMEEAREHAQQGASEAKSRTPTEVLLELQRGNARFWMGTAQRPEKSAFERRSLILSQYPSVAVLGCSDSRVPVEIVFDQGLGDLFVIRVAGNGLSVSTNASLQYAIHHLKVKVVVVMGHEGCGAIKAAQLDEETIKKEPADLAKALLGIKSGLDEKRLSCIHDPRAHDREAVVCNVTNQVKQLAKDPCLMDLVNNDELTIVGGFYEISSGIVDFFHQVSVPGSPRLASRKREGQWK